MRARLAGLAVLVGFACPAGWALPRTTPVPTLPPTLEVSALPRLLPSLNGTRPAGSTLPASPSPVDTAIDALVDVEINGQALPGVFLVERRADGHLWLPVGAWQAARLRPPDRAAQTLGDGSGAWPLQAVPGLVHHFDPVRLTLQIEAPAEAFHAQALSAAPPSPRRSLDPGSATERPPTVRFPPGAYLNYELRARLGTGFGLQPGAWFEAVGFAEAVGISSTVVGSPKPNSSGGHGFALHRLHSTAWWDLPGSGGRRLWVGDGISSSAAWSRSVRYAGLRWGRDPETAPHLLARMAPSVEGSAVVPSVIEVLTDRRQLALRHEVQPGPFTITDLPAVHGAGEVTLVVRDLLGHETRITRAYYHAPRLMPPGHHDWVVEAGWLRRGYSLGSDRYEGVFVSVQGRYGFSIPATGSREAIPLTLEMQFEWEPWRHAAGFELATIIGQWALARGTWALSHHADPLTGVWRSGYRTRLGLERASRQGAWTLQWEQADPRDRPIAWQPGEALLRDRWQLGAGMPIAGSGASVGVNVLRGRLWAGHNQRSLGLHATISLGALGHLGVHVQGVQYRVSSWNAGLTWLRSLGPQRSLASALSAAAVLSDQGQDVASALRHQFTVQGVQSAGAPDGWGARIRTVSSAGGVAQRLDLGATRQWPLLAVDLDAALDREAAIAQALARGSVGWLGARPFAARRIDREGFAWVKAGDRPGLTVWRAHQPAAKTGGDGWALVQGLAPGQVNALGIALEDLPIDWTASQHRIAFEARARRGAVIDFGVHRLHDALIVLHRPDGRPVPEGARVEATVAEARPRAVVPGVVALRGETYLAGLQPRMRVVVRWSNETCEADLVLPEAVQETPIVGPLLCTPAASDP